MASLVSFVVSAKGVPITPSNASTASLLALPYYAANQLATQGGGNQLDIKSKLSSAGYAKNGAFFLALAASTPITVDLTAIASTSTAQAGDNSFATSYSIEFTNLGSQDVKVGGAASNPFLMGLLGTTPTITIPAGGSLLLIIPAGYTIASGTNSNLKFDPGSSAAQIGVSIGGA